MKKKTNKYTSFSKLSVNTLNDEEILIQANFKIKQYQKIKKNSRTNLVVVSQ